MKGLCPECETMHTAGEPCATVTATLLEALEALTSELGPWLTTTGGLPAVIKTLGDCADLHTAQRKAYAAIAKARAA